MKEIEILKNEGCPEWVIKHSIKVYEKSKEIAKNFPEADMELIKKGALLHDLGRSRTNNITHGVIGAKIALKYGYPQEVANIIERHIGAGISKEEAIELGLPPRSYEPQTIEEKIVAHSDNLLNGSEFVDIGYTINKWKKRIKNPEDAIKKVKLLDYELIGKFKENNKKDKNNKN
ncbi:TIGR00295 family protein [Methanobrevibacter sp. 87.7]|uniref:TIGR00295 family protein n=1 Tax=Methanobrevibacter sp. 87.7 TaxID=387957 RepID=UPI000B50FB00|nr:TIGR00295 family protein [Methanobrevibacter sp. 87.7]OWT33119.1 TIGR00295 family protein [Methanobrevibacter sp. 87.7]